jgi:cytochrome c-type biogenesis protein CcmE
MNKKQRLYFILLVLFCLSTALGLSLYALRDNISLFYTPREVAQKHLAAGQRFKLGGLVKKDSLQKRGADLKITFIITDEVNEITAEYSGILPDLFREGQGVVATGSLDDKGVFIAAELLAKHDEKYMPPELAKSLEKAAKAKQP